MPIVDSTNRPAFYQQLIVGENTYAYHSLRECAEKYKIDLQKLPVSLKVLLENVLRHAENYKNISKS